MSFNFMAEVTICSDFGGHILECEVRWALESITTSKASGGDGIPVLFQILKDDAVNMGVKVPFQIKVLSGYMPRSGITGSYGNSL